MATGFNTQTGGGEYRLQFETNNEKYFLMMQEAARWCVDKKPADGFTSGVRCGECRFRDPENGRCDHPMSTILPISKKPDDFCSYGERRNDNADN